MCWKQWRKESQDLLVTGPGHRYFGALRAQLKLCPPFWTSVRIFFSVTSWFSRAWRPTFPHLAHWVIVEHPCPTFLWPLILRFPLWLLSQMWFKSNIFSNDGEGRDGRYTDTLERPYFPQRKQWRKYINLFPLYPSVFQISLSFEWLFSFRIKCQMHLVWFQNSDFMLKPTAKTTKKLRKDFQEDRNIRNICFLSL